jgi:hypothetical protein
VNPVIAVQPKYTRTGAASPHRPLPLDDRFNSIDGKISVLPIPKIGKDAGGRIPSTNAVAAHPKDASSIFEDGIHRLVAGPRTHRTVKVTTALLFQYAAPR